MAKERLSNIESCRLASILLVMLVHTTKQSLGVNMNFGALLLEGFSIIGVNVFILITGYFSATPKKTSLINLAFICMFWMTIKVAVRYSCGEPVCIKDAFFITSSNWFIASYIGLLFIAPILNVFCNTVSNRMLWGGVIALLCVEVWFDLLPPYPSVKLGTQRGYSVFSFMILYLLARAIKLYGLPNTFKKYVPYIYIVCSIVLASTAYACQLVGHNGLTKLIFAYSNPLVILSSVAFFMTFERIKVNSKLINHFAKSTLAVLLGHTAIFFLYTKQFKYLYDNYSGLQVIGYWVLAIAIIFRASIAIDQLRLLLYYPIERQMKKKIKNNEIIPIDKQ